jgi:hypothetical protein
LGRDTLLPMVETGYVFDSSIISNSILSHRIGKQHVAQAQWIRITM